MNPPRTKVGSRATCKMCGHTFVLEKYKGKQQYCSKCKYGTGRRKVKK